MGSVATTPEWNDSPFQGYVKEFHLVPEMRGIVRVTHLAPVWPKNIDTVTLVRA